MYEDCCCTCSERPVDRLVVSMTRLMIVQPYVPSYRVNFFRDLRSRLAVSGVELTLVAGRPQGSARSRSDEAGAGSVDVYLRQRAYAVGGRSLDVRFLAEHVRRTRPDLVVLEQAVKNLEAYPVLARSVLGLGASVGMWGQGRTFSTRQKKVTAAAKDWLTRRTDWFFAYTREGAEHVMRGGYPTDRVTVLNNTIDTEALRLDLESVRDDELDEFRMAHRLTPGRTALFLGGVDPDKGIDFLLAAAERAHEAMPDFRLVIAGAGSSMDEVRRRQASGSPIVHVGRVEGHAKALALKSADLMMVPQWVGLVAVDSLVSGAPIVTTRHASHSPEFGYLVDGRNALVTDHSIAAYASGVRSLLEDVDHRAALAGQAREDSRAYSLDGMVSRFTEGVLQWRDSGVLRGRRAAG